MKDLPIIFILLICHMASDGVSSISINGKHHRHHKHHYLAQRIEHAPREGEPGHDATLKAESADGEKDCFYPLKNRAGDMPPKCRPKGKKIQ